MKLNLVFAPDVRVSRLMAVAIDKSGDPVGEPAYMDANGKILIEIDPTGVSGIYISPASRSEDRGNQQTETNVASQPTERVK